MSAPPAARSRRCPGRVAGVVRPPVPRAPFLFRKATGVAAMKVTVERAELLKSLAHVHRVVERRNTIPILANVLMRSDPRGLALRATDLDIEIVETIAAEVQEEGATTVPAHTIYDIVRKLPEGAQVQIETSGDRSTLTVRAGRSRFALQTLPENEFPDLAAGEMTHSFTLPAGELKRLVDKTQFAISTEETRYYLNGIYLHVADAGGPVLRAVATDGHRLAQAQTTAPTGASGMPGVIVPRKAVAEIQRLAENADAEVTVELSAAKIRVSLDRVVLTSKLIDGTFPDYGRVIPVGNDKTLVVDKADFASAVDRVSTVASERGRAVKLSIADGKLTLSVTNPDSGSATEEIEVEYAAEPIDIGFNSRYLLDITSQIEGSTAELKLADPGSPTLVQDPDKRGALYVLMPMRV